MVLTSAARGQTTLADHLVRSLRAADDDDHETDSAGELLPAAAGTDAATEQLDAGDEDPPRRRRRTRGRNTDSAPADDTANEVLRAAYRRELDPSSTS